MNISLIGMSGAGKSTLGRKIAQKTDRDFVDTDTVIESIHEKPIEDILAELGDDGFVKIEEAAVRSIAPESSIIATGGSVIYSHEAMAHLKLLSKVVYLKLSFETITERMDDNRAAKIVGHESEGIEAVFEERAPLYEEYADEIVVCEGRSIEECIAELQSILQTPETQSS